MTAKGQIAHTVKKDKTGAPGVLQAGLPDLSLQEDYEENISGNYFQAKKENNEVRNNGGRFAKCDRFFCA